MEDIKKSKKNINSDKKVFSLSFFDNVSPNNQFKNLNPKNYNKSHYEYKYKHFIKSNKFFSKIPNNLRNNQFSLSCDILGKDSFQKNETFNDNKISNNKEIRNIKRIDVGIQSDLYIPKYFTPKNKFQFLRKIINDTHSKNSLEDIDYVLESPFRGVEKIGLSSTGNKSKNKNKNYFHPIFINNNYKGYFCLNNSIKTNLSHKNNLNKTNKDIYIKVNNNKKLNNPLKKLSKISGFSSTKIRKIIEYSLSNRLINFENIINEKFKLNKINFTNHLSMDNKKNKSKYSTISLKSKQNKKKSFEDIMRNNLNMDKAISYENIFEKKNIFKNKIKRINYFNKKNLNYSPIFFEKDINLFKNLKIKNKIK